MNGHRSKFYEILRSGNYAYDDDEQILGAYLVDQHGMRDKPDFNKNYKLFIIAQVSPSNLRKFEQLWIDKLNSLRPFGLNQCKSIS